MAENKVESAGVSLEKNNVTLPLDSYTIVRGVNEGKKYLCPTISAQTWDNFVTFVGIDNIIDIVQGSVKKAFQGLNKKFTKEDGSFDDVGFKAAAADFTTTGARIGELETMLEEVGAEMDNYLSSDEFMSAEGDKKTPGTPAFLAIQKLTAMKDRRNNLRALIEAKKRSKETDEEAAPSVKG